MNTSLLSEMKEEMNYLKIKQEESSFDIQENEGDKSFLFNEGLEEINEAPKSDNYLYCNVKEENVISKEITEDYEINVEKSTDVDKEHENQPVELIYMKTNKEEEWFEPSGQESDPLAVLPAAETEVKSDVHIEEDFIVDAGGSIATDTSNPSTSHDTPLLRKDNCSENPGMSYEGEHTVSGDEILHKWTSSDYSTSSSSLFLRHMRMHKGEEIYKCTECDFSASHSSYVSKHMKIVHKEKPHKCTECDLSFPSKYRLYIHIMSKHTGEKLHKCTVCNYSAPVRYQIKKHMLKHTGEKPHKCTECDFSSSYRYQLKKHMSTHTT